jgi:hypothetical protein
LKVVGESDKDNASAKSTVKCPRCNEQQIVAASNIISVIQDREEAIRIKGLRA